MSKFERFSSLNTLRCALLQRELVRLFICTRVRGAGLSLVTSLVRPAGRWSAIDVCAQDSVALLGHVPGAPTGCLRQLRRDGSVVGGV